jgi:hypothetical protein
LASLDPTAPTVAKVTDFGETRGLLLKLKGRENLLNPSWLAPELMLDEPYTEKADVFPFGIILWELMIRQHPYSEYPISQLQFTTPLETAIIQGLRPSFGPTFEHYPSVVAPLTPQPYARLAQRCWADDPEDRPSFEQIVPELRCLRMEICHDTSQVAYIPDMFPNLKQASSSRRLGKIGEEVAGSDDDKEVHNVGFISVPNILGLASTGSTSDPNSTPGSSPTSSTTSSPLNSGLFPTPPTLSGSSSSGSGGGSGSANINLSLSLSSVTPIWRRVGVEGNSPRKVPLVGGKRGNHTTMTAPPDCRSNITRPPR